MSNIGTGGWMQWWTGQGRYTHPKRASLLPPASAPSKTSGAAREPSAAPVTLHAGNRLTIHHYGPFAIPYQISLPDTRRRDRLAMVTLPVVGRHKFGSSILLLEWVLDAPGTWLHPVTLHECNSLWEWWLQQYAGMELRVPWENRSWCILIKLKKKKSVTCLNAFALLGDLLLLVTPAS